MNAPKPENDDQRYVAQAINGGPRWGVFDRQKSRFLLDAEILSISDHDLATATVSPQVN